MKHDFARHGHSPCSNPQVRAWVQETAELTQPDRIFWCDGSDAERDALNAEAVRQGTLITLNQDRLPGCYYHRSHPNDVARVEQCTYICSESEVDAGPTNNWAEPKAMRAKLLALAKDSMTGRTMFVVPYLMGPASSPLSKVGFEITDSIYVVLNMRIMARIGKVAGKHLGDSPDFNRGLHCLLDLNPERRFICHFPERNEIISVGSGYGGNALLGKKCLALRIASVLGRKEGWLAEHMLILGVESPTGEKTFVAAAFPSQCGKTNFAMMVPPAGFDGWKVWTVGDDIAWMKPGPDGRLYAINPEAGYFGVAPGTNAKTNPNAMRTIQRDTIFTNVALKPDGTVWWEGHDDPPPAECLDWQGRPWTPNSKEKAAHPNSRFTAPMANNPMLAPEADQPEGVPIDAIIFGGRRPTTVPLVLEAFNWSHGVFLGATMGSETTAASSGTVGQIRRDPMAMLPFCGYNMGRYFRHWLDMRKAIKFPPRVFNVNWFRQDADGQFLWPGFGQNMRVLQWIIARCRGRASAQETPLGWMPLIEDFNLAGLANFPAGNLERLQAINPDEWRREILQQDELFMKLYQFLPKEMIFQRELLVARL
ncbi:MAG TPA: phosphoenolpyruvate carboxykinase (GTP) [Verrucomicrobiota bacterium]|nr:phosphoenolpyruvate carboxykinase (GTP) [Verrucomicrobiales bacterium]HRI16068.1 phosphoenolpyruvate carboxykinase (GTP) [Verrucomicrobiota bacterium]